LNNIKTICNGIFVLCLPVLLLAGSLAWGFNSRWLYNYSFEKYNVSQQTGFSPVELDKAARGLIGYFNSGDEYVHIILIRNGTQVELFTREEQIHFKDVKLLVLLDYKVLFVAFMLVLSYALFKFFWKRGRNKHELFRYLVWGCSLSIALILIIGIASFFDFDQLFLQFHELVFSNQYWSAQGYMLLLFPGGFWYDAAIFCLAFMAALAILTGIISVLWLRLENKKERKE
jgi:integral membrane protein (TIGR01906 family)